MEINSLKKDNIKKRIAFLLFIIGFLLIIVGVGTSFFMKDDNVSNNKNNEENTNIENSDLNNNNTYDGSMWFDTTV